MKHLIWIAAVAWIAPGATLAEICFADNACDNRGFVCRSTLLESVSQLESTIADYNAMAAVHGDLVDQYNTLAETRNAEKGALQRLQQAEEALQREKQWRSIDQAAAKDAQEALKTYRLCYEISQTMAEMETCLGG